MAAELERYARDILEQLPPRDPQRKFIQGIIRITEAYNASQPPQKQPLPEYSVDASEHTGELEVLGLTNATRNLLFRHNLTSVREIDELPDETLVSFNGMGAKRLGEIRAKIDRFREKLTMQQE